jgi:hypothetical protein
VGSGLLDRVAVEATRFSLPLCLLERTDLITVVPFMADVLGERVSPAQLPPTGAP